MIDFFVGVSALIIIIILVQALIVGIFCSYIASQKNRSKFVWFILGFFFSALALIALVAIPSLPKKQEGMKKCPFCAEFIKLEAAVCRYCNKDISGGGRMEIGGIVIRE